MKDWDIRRGKVTGQWELVHLACDAMWISSPDMNGDWRCLECEEKAPEEMQFCAELARCRTRAGSFPARATGWAEGPP